jgi:hypothetical protein
MGTDRLFRRKKPTRRPKKKDREKKRRQKAQRKRLIGLGMPADQVAAMDPTMVRTLLKYPARFRKPA